MRRGGGGGSSDGAHEEEAVPLWDWRERVEKRELAYRGHTTQNHMNPALGLKCVRFS
jgi:hypothetical protein